MFHHPGGVEAQAVGVLDLGDGLVVGPLLGFALPIGKWLVPRLHLGLELVDQVEFHRSILLQYRKLFCIVESYGSSRPSASRSVEILNFLAAHAPEQFTLSEISAALTINLASTHALLNTLEAAGYVIRHPRLRTYSLGASVVALGNAALQSHPAIACANDEAQGLSAELGLSVAVTADAGNDIVFLGRMGEHRPRDVEAYAGQRIPLSPPVGAVFVAWRDPEAWLAKASDRASMESILDEVRSRGWAASFEPDHYQPLGSMDPDRLLQRRDGHRARVRAHRHRRRRADPSRPSARLEC